MPITIQVDLPLPISVNRIWRGTKGRVYRSKEYVDWMNQSLMLWITQRSSQPKMIEGPFKAMILLKFPDNRRRDIDNFCKPVLDFAQKATIIEDDRDCHILHVEMVPRETIPMGARLVLTSVL